MKKLCQIDLAYGKLDTQVYHITKLIINFSARCLFASIAKHLPNRHSLTFCSNWVEKVKRW